LSKRPKTLKRPKTPEKIGGDVKTLYVSAKAGLYLKLKRKKEKDR